MIDDCIRLVSSERRQLVVFFFASSFDWYDGVRLRCAVVGRLLLLFDDRVKHDRLLAEKLILEGKLTFTDVVFSPACPGFCFFAGLVFFLFSFPPSSLLGVLNTFNWRKRFYVSCGFVGSCSLLGLADL